MLTRWQGAVLDAIHRYTASRQTRLVARSALIREELDSIIQDAGATGATPAQTLSRVLQELRHIGVLQHVDRGVDLLLDTPLSVESEDLPDTALDAAIEHDQLRISDVATDDAQAITRRRKGQARIRQHIIAAYDHRCALCDVSEPDLLVASHIATWSENPDARGRLSNVLCLCRMHDALFEHGYIALADDLSVLRRDPAGSSVVGYLQHTSDQLRAPQAYPPAPAYLKLHRQRTGFDKEEP